MRIVIADDQSLLLGALCALVSLEPDCEVVGSATDGLEALKTVRETTPDILLADIEMPGISGIELASVVVRELKTRVVILTAFARPGYLRRALEAGARGYILKDSPPDKLIQTLRKVHRGQKAIDPELAVEAWDDFDPLSKRERQVLALAEEGLQSKQIGERLYLTAGTVRNHISEAITKLGVSNRMEAVRIARNRGWL